jgi:hypothetical protein
MTVWTKEIAIEDDPFYRLYLCVPRLMNKKHEYVCYRKKHIYSKDLVHPDVEYTRILALTPSIFDKYILQNRLKSDVYIVVQKRGKGWQGCYADYTIPRSRTPVTM